MDPPLGSEFESLPWIIFVGHTHYVWLLKFVINFSCFTEPKHYMLYCKYYCTKAQNPRRCSCKDKDLTEMEAKTLVDQYPWRPLPYTAPKYLGVKICNGRHGYQKDCRARDMHVRHTIVGGAWKNDVQKSRFIADDSWTVSFYHILHNRFLRMQYITCARP